MTGAVCPYCGDGETVATVSHIECVKDLMAETDTKEQWLADLARRFEEKP